MAEEAEQGDLGLVVEQATTDQDSKQHKAKKSKKSAAQPSLGLTIEEDRNVATLDVANQRKEILGVLDRAYGLGRFQKASYIKRELVDKHFKNLAQPKRMDALYDAEGGNLENVEIEIDNFLHSANGVSVKNGYIEGNNVGASSDGIHLENVILVSEEGFAGSTVSDEVNDIRGIGGKRSLDCQNLYARNCVLTGKNIGRNAKRAVLVDCVVDSEGGFEDAWGGSEFIRVVVRGQNGNKPISKKFPLARPLTSRQKPENAPVTHRFVGKRFR